MTALWTAADAAHATGGHIAPGANWAARGLSIDTRAVAADDLFVALKGPRFDGHDFVSAALDQGAAAAMVDHAPAGADPARLLAVPDTQAGLEDLARAARARSSARIVAVTGSVGKTGTKEALALLLGRQGLTHASSGNLNNHIGLPLSLARLPASAQFGVFEIGMNHAAEISPLSRILRPHVAIITTVEAVHLENFPDVAAIADAKAEIFEGLEPGGVAILNHDNPYFDRLAAHAHQAGVSRVWGFGEAEEADGRLVSVALDAFGSTVEAVILGRGLGFRLNLAGRHHAMNALAVLLAVAALEGDVDAAALALADLAPVKGRGVAIEIPVMGGHIRLIDESYNASPVAVRAALSVLAMMEPQSDGRKLVVLGDMLELGEAEAAAHAELAQPLIGAGVHLVFTAGPLSRQLYEALPAGIRGGHAADSGALAPILTAAVKAGDIVLIKGSAGSKMGNLVAALRGLAAENEKTRHAL